MEKKCGEIITIRSLTKDDGGDSLTLNYHECNIFHLLTNV
jgi:hypothetical protein